MVFQKQFIFRIGMIILIIILFLGYGTYEAKKILGGPKIEIDEPKEKTIKDYYIEIKGRAQNISLLYLNGRQIFTDENGNFKEGVLLATGNNIIEIKAKDKFNRETKKILDLVLK